MTRGRTRTPAGWAGRGLAWGVGLGATAWLVEHFGSRAVQAWRPATGDRRRLGALSVRVAGSGPRSFLLLHGLAGSGDTFGAAYDRLAAHGQLVVPDLLGFGQSMDGGRTAFGLAAHLDALDAMVEGLGVAAGPLAIGGHSMGGVLALCWAARRPERVERVVVWGAPLYRSPAEAERYVRAMGIMGRFFALDTPLTQAACGWMCRHRRISGWIAVLVAPSLPVALAKQGVLHTWPSYRDAMNEIVLGADWAGALRGLDAAGVPVVLAAGRRDRAPVRGLAEELARSHSHVRALEHPTAGHDLPLADPAWCVGLLTAPAPPRA
jgi:pimeloyl-ACP methyl ester carboxylesterase